MMLSRCITNCKSQFTLYLPMKNVKYSIKTQKQNHVCCDVLDILKFYYHIQLRQNRQSLQPYRKSPKYAIKTESLMQNKTQCQCNQIQKVMWKYIRLMIIALIQFAKYQFIRTLKLYQIYRISCDTKKNESHQVEIKRTPMILEDHIRISREKNQHVHLLCAIRYSYDIFSSCNFKQQHQYCNQMKEITHELKYVHVQ